MFLSSALCCSRLDYRYLRIAEILASHGCFPQLWSNQKSKEEILTKSGVVTNNLHGANGFSQEVI